MTSPTLDSALLDRYLAGECTPPEHALVAAWLASHASAARLLEALWRLDHDPASVMHDDTEAADVAALRAALSQRLLGTVKSPPSRTTPPALRAAREARSMAGSSATRWIATGAVCLAIVAGAGLLWRGRSASPVSSRSYATTTGKLATYELPDGSRMTLAPSTTVRVPSGFGDDTRTIVLDGEAYFDVRSDRGTPFLVRTGDVTTRVLGTRFDVRRYGADRSTHVAVASGRVSVQGERRGRQPIVLSAGMIASMTDTTAVVTTGADSAAMGSWRDGALVFVNAPLSDVLAAITRWYGYEFRGVDSTMLRSEISIRVSDRSPRDAMALLETALNVSLTFGGEQGRIVTVRPNPRRPLADEQSRRHPIGWQPQEVGR